MYRNRRLDADIIKQGARPCKGWKGEAIIYLLTDVVTTEQGTYIPYATLLKSSEKNDAC